MDTANASGPSKLASNRNRIVVGVFLCAIIVSLSIAYSFWRWFLTGGSLSAEERYFHAAVIKALEKQGETIPIGELTNFTWKRVCFAVPYETQDQVEKKTGISFPTYYSQITWDYHDNFWTLLFVDKNSRLVPIRIPRIDIGTYPRTEDGTRMCADFDRAVLKVIRLRKCEGCAMRKLLLSEK